MYSALHSNFLGELLSHSRALRLKNDDNVKVTSPHKNLTACDSLWITQLIQALCDAYHQSVILLLQESAL